MPSIKNGETEEEYVARCIPVRINEGDTPEHAAAACHGMYRQHKEKGTQYSKNMEVFHDDKRLYMLDCTGEYIPRLSTDLGKLGFDTNVENVYRATCLIGDRFYKNKFISNIELQRAYKSFDRSVHDVNHWSTTYLDGHPNIEYVVGYQDNVLFDGSRLSADIHINPSAPKYSVWRNYVDICKTAGRIPNVSVAFWASSKPMHASELPVGINYRNYGYSKDDMIPCITDIEFKALATVLEGSCNDKDGCGIGIGLQQDKTIQNKDKEKKENMNELNLPEDVTIAGLIQKCIEETKLKNPEVPDEEIKKTCTMKFTDIGIDTDRGGGSTRSSDRPFTDLDLILEHKKEQNLLMRKLKYNLEETKK